MASTLLKAVKTALPECNKLPERAKEILNTVNNSLNNLNESDSKQLWILLLDFINETSVLEDLTQDTELLKCYKCVLNLVHSVINCADKIQCICEDENLTQIIITFQTFYSKDFTNTFKMEIVKMCLGFWQLFTSNQQNQRKLETFHFNAILKENLIFTLTYIFDNIKVAKKKLNVKLLSSTLWEFTKAVCSLISNENIFNFIESNLENLMKFILFLDCEPGKMTISDIFTTNEDLFLRLHNIVITNIPYVNKPLARAYGEIYFIAWINSNSSMREIIEQQGMFDLIYRSFTLQRSGPSFQTYHNILLFMQSMQKHRKHLIFSKIITKLYTPVLWRHLRSNLNMVRCNAVEILSRAYPLEKRGEGREVASRFLTKQQTKFIDLLEDPCPQVRVATIKGLCSCMRYFWESFEDDTIRESFRLFTLLLQDNITEVRLVVIYGFTQLIEEYKSHKYFKKTILANKIKITLRDENEKVRRAIIQFLLKVKKVDTEPKSKPINYVTIISLSEIASALAVEVKQNGLLLVDLIFDNFIGAKVPTRNATLLRFIMFYKLNPVAYRNFMFYSEKNLNFIDACQLILSLLRTLYIIVKKKQKLKLKNKKENETNVDDSDNSQSDFSSSSLSIAEYDIIGRNEHVNVCCILDTVHILIIVHRDKFIEKNNYKQFKEVQDSCTHVLITVLKFYKDGDAYYSAISLASIVPVSKLNSSLSISSTAISSLKQLPSDIKSAEEKIDLRKVDCLVYTLCMWNRGYEILQFVNIWFDDCFKTLNLNDSLYPDDKTNKRKRVRFQTNIEECKPMTGILLINSMLINQRTQSKLMSSDVNRKNIYDLSLYLQRVKPAIENRISSDNILNNLLSDQVLQELLRLKLRLHIIYHSHEANKNINEIINYKISLLDWVINNLLIHDLCRANEATVTFVVKIIEIINSIVLNLCLMGFVNKTLFDKYYIFCTNILQNIIGPRIVMNTVGTLTEIANHLNYLKITHGTNNKGEIPGFSHINCVRNAISVIGGTKLNEENFNNVIGAPMTFRCALIRLSLAVYNVNIIEFKQLLTSIIETIVNIIADEIKEIGDVDLNENLINVPYIASQLAMLIISNAKLRKYFSLVSVNIFSSNKYKNDCIFLLSAIYFIYTLSFKLIKTKVIDLEPVVKLLYKILMKRDENDLTKQNITVNLGELSVLETSSFSDNITDLKQKGRKLLIATAKQLHITLCD